MIKKHRILSVLSFLFLTAFLCGCETIRYYGQAVSGQIKILKDRQPIQTLLDAPKTPDQLKIKLQLVLSIREFAKNELLLPIGDHYLSYTDLKRPYAVWTVYAAPEFSMKPKTWYYPFIGRTSYRGFFSESDAKECANRLKKEGFDVYVGGASAYSTLGWFDDSVFSTIINRSEAGIAALIFHELAHQLLYVKGDTVFNESFATAVEEEGLRRWLISSGKNEAYEKYLTGNRRHREFIELILKYRHKLENLYEKKLPVNIKRQRKKKIFTALKKDHPAIKKKWNGYSGYDLWFSRPMNNARLVPIGVYHDFVPSFKKILAEKNEDLQTFYEECKALAKENGTERHDRLNSLISVTDP